MTSYRQSMIRENLFKRAALLGEVRCFFESEGFLEVETPFRVPAPAPEAHIEPEPSGEWFLHTSPELWMKRLLCAGFHHIFQICRCFRRNERGDRHLPEFTLLEWYGAPMDYMEMMDQTQRLILRISERLGEGGAILRDERKISLSAPFARMSVAEAFERYASISVEKALDQDRFDEIMGLAIEPNLGWDRPLFLYDYPVECAALARPSPTDPRIAERFELYIAGLELCNGFGELRDPDVQRLRFESVIRDLESRGLDAFGLPESFLRSLPDMPDASGNALGIDRLVMLFTRARTIDEVSAFVPEEL